MSWKILDSYIDACKKLVGLHTFGICRIKQNWIELFSAVFSKSFHMLTCIMSFQQDEKIKITYFYLCSQALIWLRMPLLRTLGVLLLMDSFLHHFVFKCCIWILFLLITEIFGGPLHFALEVTPHLPFLLALVPEIHSREIHLCTSLPESLKVYKEVLTRFSHIPVYWKH